MVHIMGALGGAPLRVILDQLYVEATGCADVKRALADLFDSADASQRQEEAEVIGKIRISAGDDVAGSDVLGFKISAVGGEDKLRLALVVAGLSLRAAMVWATCPLAQVLKWMLLV